MMVNLRDSGHPIFRGTSTLDRGPLKSKGSKKSTHYKGDPATAELLFRIIHSVRQLSICGAVSDWCKELAHQISDPSSSSTGKLVADVNDESESKVVPTAVSILTNSPFINVPVQGNVMRQHKERFENLPEDIRVSKTGDDAGFIRKVSREQYFVTIHHIALAGFGYAGSCREFLSPRDDQRSKLKGWIRGNTKLGQCWTSRSQITWNVLELKSRLIPWTTMDLNPGL